MSIEDIIRAWKSDEETLEPHWPANPVGRELLDQELLEVAGGITITLTPTTCDGKTCEINVTCRISL